MIPFFRRVRKKLADDNKPLKYMRYAFGEIVLVVIGILFALQVNNWNQIRLEKKTEQKALINLEQDFKFNKNTILNLVRKSDSIINISLLVLNHTGNKYQSGSNMNVDSMLEALVTTPDYFPKNGFLDDLINSGQLGLIQNEQLRMLLSSWNPTVENIKEREINSIMVDNKIEDFINENGNWINNDQNKYVHLGLPKSGFHTNNNELLKHQKFENLVESHVISLDGLKIRYAEALELLDEILKTIEKEIEN